MRTWLLVAAAIAALGGIDVFLADHVRWMDGGMILIADTILAIAFFAVFLSIRERQERSRQEWTVTPEIEPHLHDHAA